MLKLLVATDGGKHFIRTAVAVQKLLAESDDVEAVVLYVSTSPVPYYQRTELGMLHNLPEQERAFTEKTRHEVEALFSPWSNRVRFRHRVGPTVAQICETARQEQADMIVVGNHGNVGDRFSAVCQGVLAAADRPVIVVK